MNSQKPSNHITMPGSKLTQVTKILPYLLFLVCLTVLGVFILLGTYSHPSSDDFCLASGINHEGLFNHLWKHYLEWSGRYTANALYGVYPMIFGLFEGYWLIPVILLISLFATTTFFLSNLFRINITAAPVLLSSLAFVCIFVLGMMSVASGLYWMAGALTYQSANILLLVILGLSIRLLDQQEHSKQHFRTFATLLVVIIIAMGTNETSMLALTTIVCLVFIMQLRSGWVKSKPWFILLAITLICFAIVIVSPGNAIRAADFPMRHDLSRSIAGSLTMGTKILWIWISSPLLLTSSMLAPFATARLYQLSDRTFVISKSLLVKLVFGTLAIPILMQFPAWWGMGGWPPARTIDAIYFLFLISWFLTIGAITIHLIPRDKLISGVFFSQPIVSIVLIVASALFTITAVNSKNSQLAWDDLQYHAKPYHEYMTARYKLIEHALAMQEFFLIVPDYHQQYPRSIYFNDIMHNSRHWRNICYAHYFGLQKIKRSR
jgi:hypothetical protein